MVMLFIILQDVTPKWLSCFFLWLFPKWHLFFTKVSLKNLFLLLGNIWFCLHCLLHFFLYTYFLILWAISRAFILRIPLLLLDLTLLLVCISFMFFVSFWRSFGLHFSDGAMSVNIDRSTLMPLIWFSILVFRFGCIWILLLLFLCYFQLNSLVCLFYQQLSFSVYC